MNIPIINDAQIESLLNYQILIDALDKGLKENLEVPQRIHHDLNYNLGEMNPTLLLMPAWQTEKYIGIKIVSIFPLNKKIPSIQGVYLLMDGKDGRNLCLIDAKKLTTKRTAAVSALMSRYLSREDSKTLLIVGTGNLAPELIKAHCTTRSIEKVLIWGRSQDKVKTLINNLQPVIKSSLEVCPDLAEGCRSADIISTATMSTTPLIFGDWIESGTHIDLVGSYRPSMREADDQLLSKSTLFVDTIQGATKESGDLFIPLDSGVIKLSDIKASMFDLCMGVHPGRRSRDEITWFKSVGHASEDLIAAYTLYQKIQTI